MKNKYKKLFVTGGHITPAIAVIDKLIKIHPDWKIILIGRNFLEESIAREKNISYIPSFAGRLSSIIKIPMGFFQALWYCLYWKPDLVVSFGGYVAVPVSIAAWICGIPVITHEQTHTPGFANRCISVFARRICITFKDSFNKFPKEKTVVTGLPVRQELFSPPKLPPFSVNDTRAIMYITGGSTGSVSLNDIFFQIIPDLLKRYTVIHQTGTPSFAKAKEIHDAHYIARDFFDVTTVSWILSNASLVVGRTGANTVMELAMFNKRTICIPLPWSAGGEQQDNALWLQSLGLGRIIDQEKLSPNILLAAIEEEIAKPRKTNFLKTIPTDGSRRMVAQIDAILG